MFNISHEDIEKKAKKLEEEIKNARAGLSENPWLEIDEGLSPTLFDKQVDWEYEVDEYFIKPILQRTMKYDHVIDEFQEELYALGPLGKAYEISPRLRSWLRELTPSDPVPFKLEEDKETSDKKSDLDHQEVLYESKLGLVDVGHFKFFLEYTGKTLRIPIDDQERMKILKILLKTENDSPEEPGRRLRFADDQARRKIIQILMRMEDDFFMKYDEIMMIKPGTLGASATR